MDSATPGMRIMIMRHAQALTRQQANVPYDADRPLSEAGRAEASRLGRFLHRHNLLPDPIVCSPFIRTQETAALIAKELGGHHGPMPLTLLAPGSGPDELLRAAMNHGQTDQRWLLAVLHEPDVSHILSQLLFGDRSWPQAVKTGDLFALDIRRGHGGSRAELTLFLAAARLPDA